MFTILISPAADAAIRDLVMTSSDAGGTLLLRVLHWTG